jgi:hypothetical protein
MTEHEDYMCPQCGHNIGHPSECPICGYEDDESSSIWVLVPGDVHQAYDADALLYLCERSDSYKNLEREFKVALMCNEPPSESYAGYVGATYDYNSGVATHMWFVHRKLEPLSL